MSICSLEVGWIEAPWPIAPKRRKSEATSPTAAEVPVTNVDQAERLEVGDRGLALGVGLRRGEAEEELGGLGDQVRPGHAGRRRHRLRQAPCTAEAAALEALADARQLEEVAGLVEERLRAVGDMLAPVAADEDCEVICLEDGVPGIARKPRRVEQGRDRTLRALRRPSVNRDMAVGQGSHVAAEVGAAPGNRDREPGRRHLVAALETPERLLERLARLQEIRSAGLDPQ